MAVQNTRKLGRHPRAHGANVPHLSAIVAGTKTEPAPDGVDYLSTMPQYPNKFGMKLNDILGDCTCAAFYHARQVWAYHAIGDAKIQVDDDVLVLYEKACGYKKSDRGEGPGGTLQTVLTYIHKRGAPTGPSSVDTILGFVEVDPRNIDDVKRTIVHGGVILIGFPLPAYVSPPVDVVPAVWDVQTADAEIIGGHAVAAAAYDAVGLTVISWGYTYKMTWAFFAKYVDEAYAVSDRLWHESAFARERKLALPGNLSPQQLTEQMQFL